MPDNQLFEDFLARDKQRFGDDPAVKAGRVQVRVNAGKPADAAAQHAKLAERYGVPVAAVSVNPQPWLERAASDDAQAAIDSNPKLGAWMARPGNAAQAHDDVANMAAAAKAMVEWTGSVARGIIQTGVNGIAARTPAKAQTYGSIISDDPQSLSVIQDTAQRPFSNPDGLKGLRFGRAGSAVNRGFQQMVIGLANGSLGAMAAAAGTEDITAADPLRGQEIRAQNRAEIITSSIDWQKKLEAQSLAEGPTGAITRGIYSGLESLPTSAAALATSILFTPAAGVAVAADITGGQSYVKGKSEGLSDAAALRFAAVDAAIEGVTEWFPLHGLVKNIKVGAPMLDRIMQNWTAENVGEQFATLGQDFNQWASIDVNKGKSFGDFIAERPAAALQTLIATTVGVGAVNLGISATQQAARIVVGRLQQAQNAEHAEALTTALAQIAEASKLRERNVDSFESWIKAAADGTEATDVFIEAGKLVEVLEQSGLTGEQIVQALPSLEGQLDEALRSNSDVRIPIEEFAARSAELGPALIPHLRIDPNDMSSEEAKVFLQGAQEELQTQADAIFEKAAATDDFRASAERVREAVLLQLNSANRFTSDVNAAYASLHANFFAQLAADMGVTPEEMAARYQLNIQAESVADGERVMDQATADRVKDRAIVNIGLKRTNDPAAPEATNTPESTLEALRSMGVNVLSHTVRDVTHKYGTETTLIARVDRPLTSEEGDALSEITSLAQQSVAQFTGQEGNLVGPMAAEWGPFDPELFALPEGVLLSEVDPRSFLTLMVLAEEFSNFGSVVDLGNQGIFSSDTLGFMAKRKAQKMREKMFNNAYGLMGLDRTREHNRIAGAMEATMTAGVWAKSTGEYARRTRRRDMEVLRDAAVREGFDSKNFRVNKDGTILALIEERDAYRVDDPMWQERAAKIGFTMALASDPKWIVATPAQVERPPIDAEGKITLQHFSPVGDLTTTDPTKWGASGHFLPKSEREQIGKAPPRTYFGIATGQVGGYINEFGNSRTLYEARIDASRLYDMASNPDKMKDETAVAEAGYAGYWTNDPSLGLVAAVFNYIEVSKVPSASAFYEQGALSAFVEGSATLTGQNTTASYMMIREANTNGITTGTDTAASEEAGTQNTAGEPASGRPGSPADEATQDGQLELYPGVDFGVDPSFIGVDVIDVDGVDRPTSNADGEPIAATRQAVQAFWRWFGDSKAVDGDGHPIVFYHGTGHRFDEFRADAFSFFAKDRSTSEAFAGTGGRVIPVYLRIEDVDYYDAEDRSWAAVVEEEYSDDDIESALDKYIEDNTVDQSDVGSVEEVEITDATGTRTIFRVDHPDTEGVDFSTEDEALTYLDDLRDAAAEAQETSLRETSWYELEEQEYLTPNQTSTNALADAAHGRYDAVWIDAVDEGAGPTTVVIVLGEPTNIKSAEGNRTFNPDDPRIMFQSNADTPKLAETASGGFPLFQRATDQAPRGQIAFGADITASPSTITILRKADLSTFIHESGHFFLEVMMDVASRPDAPQRVLDDLQTFLKWTGVESIGHWREMPLAEKRPHHERFARGFEAFLFEGNVPSIEMRGVYRKFRDWLVNVYQSLSRLNVELTDEVRGVFGRMLASQAEIDEAQALAEYEPALTEKPEGMTDGEWLAYQRLGQEATEEAQETLERRSLRDMRYAGKATARELKRLQKEVKDKRDAVREEATASVAAEPVYQAINFLRRGILNGEPVEGPHKLSIAEVKAAYQLADESFFKRLGYGKYGMLAEDGIHPQQVAELFGFTSADHLIQALVDAQPFAQVVEAETDRTMLERYGDLSSPQALQSAVDQAIHNDVRGRFVATEYAALSKAPGKPRVLAAAARHLAEAQVSRLKVRNVRPAQFEAAERRAAKAAAEASRSGDIPSAAAEKRNQLLNFYGAKVARDALERSRKIVDYFKKFDTAATRKALDAGYRDQIDQMLERFDLRISTTNRDADRRKSLVDWVERQRELGFDPVIDEELMNEARRMPWRELTVSELDGLYDAIRNIEHLARLKQKLLTAKDKREFQDAVSDVAASIRDNAYQVKPTIIGAKTWGQSAMSLVNDFFAMHRKIANLFFVMDGNKYGGAAWERFIRPMNDAGDREAVMNEAATQALGELFKQLKGQNTTKKVFVPEIGSSLSLEDRLMVALNMGNEGNLQRLLDGDRWEAPQLNAVLEPLTAEHWQFVQSVWDYLNSFYPEIAAKELRVSGIAPARVEPLPFTRQLADGTSLDMRGGYFPIKYDPDRSSKADADTAADVLRQMTQGKYTNAQTRRGHTKARAENVDRALRKDFGVIFEHVNQVIHDLAWHEYLIDANRLLKAGEIDDAIRTAYGPNTIRWIRKALEDIAIGDIPAQNVAERAVNYLRTGVSVAQMGWNLMTALMQPLGLTQSWSRIGGKWVAKGIGRVLGDAAHLQSTATWVYERSDFMRLRAKTQNREINEIRNKVAAKGPLRRAIGKVAPEAAVDAVGDSFFLLMGKLQMVADLPTWIGQYEKMMAAGETEERAADLADQAVLDSQGGGQIQNLAGIQRGNPVLKLFTNFYSYFSVTYNLLADRTSDLKRVGYRDMPAFAADVFLLTFLPSALSTLLYTTLKGDDDDWDIEKLTKKIGTDAIGYWLGLMVGMREIGGAFTGAGTTYQGPAGTRAFAELNKLGKQVQQGEADEALARSVNNTAGVLLHYPSTQVDRTVRGIRDWANGEADARAVVAGPPPKR